MMKKILVAHDEDMIAPLYADELWEEDYEVIYTSEGASLMETVEKQQPDLIVLDVKMGQHDGLDLLQEIRSIYYNMPVILSSPVSHFKYDLRAIAADYYVVKSEDLSELKVKLNRALEGNLAFLAEKCVRKRPGEEEQRGAQMPGAKGAWPLPMNG